MRTHSLVLLSFAASILGYKIITPNGTNNWTNSGPQPATWQQNASDAQNFTVVLSNADTSFYGDQVLSALVNGSSLSTTFNPPSEGWPVGDNFRLSFVKDVNDLTTFFTQSDEFSIELPSQNSSSSATPTPTPSPVGSTPIVANPTPVTTAGSQTTGTSNHANPRNDVHAALMGVFGLVGLVLAQSLA